MEVGMVKNPALYDIIILGNYTKDTYVSKRGIRFVDGGGFNFGAHAVR
jgi:hypothetical protein